MPLEKGNLLEFNQYMNSDQITCIIYADIESLIKKIDGCAKNGNIFLADIQCQLYGLLILQKTSIL